MAQNANNLPDEILALIFGYLPRTVVANCARVCKCWRPVAETEICRKIDFGSNWMRKAKRAARRKLLSKIASQQSTKAAVKTVAVDLSHNDDISVIWPWIVALPRLSGITVWSCEQVMSLENSAHPLLLLRDKPTLTTCKVSSIEIQLVIELLGFIGSLQSFTAYNMDWNRDTNARDEFDQRFGLILLQSCCNLRKFVIECDTHSVFEGDDLLLWNRFASWLPGTLMELEVDDACAGNLSDDDISKITPWPAAQLTRLKMEEPYNTDETGRKCINLTRFTKLEQFEFVYSGSICSQIELKAPVTLREISVLYQTYSSELDFLAPLILAIISLSSIAHTTLRVDFEDGFDESPVVLKALEAVCHKCGADFVWP